MHHEFTAPIALVAIYCTPLEFLLAEIDRYRKIDRYVYTDR